MNNLKEYILEKFKISKDNSKPSLGNNLDKSYIEIVNIITDYLSNKDYFDFDINDYKLSSKNENEISLSLPKDIKKSLIESIGINIAIKIDRELKLDWYWSYDSDKNTISWSEGII